MARTRPPPAERLGKLTMALGAGGLLLAANVVLILVSSGSMPPVFARAMRAVEGALVWHLPVLGLGGLALILIGQKLGAGQERARQLVRLACVAAMVWVVVYALHIGSVYGESMAGVADSFPGVSPRQAELVSQVIAVLFAGGVITMLALPGYLLWKLRHPLADTSNGDSG